MANFLYIKNAFHAWNRKLQSVMQVVENTSFWKDFSENGKNQVFIYFENLCCKDLRISNVNWYISVCF